MDIKDLNKSQLLLLAILLSFVTSIATGITTVTLMQQAPESVTVPVNRVIRQTVEKIQQVEGKTTVQTVVVKEEDLVVDAIAKNKGALFSVTKELEDGGYRIEVSAGRGFAVSADGLVAVDGSQVYSNGIHYLTNDSGKFKATFVSSDPAGFAFLKVGEAVNETDKATFTVPDFGDLSKMKIGQKILVLGQGLSSSIFEGLNENGKIDLTISKANAGAAVLNLDGEVLGMALSSETSSFVPIKSITDAQSSTVKPTVKP